MKSKDIANIVVTVFFFLVPFGTLWAVWFDILWPGLGWRIAVTGIVIVLTIAFLDFTTEITRIKVQRRKRELDKKTL